MKDKQTSSTETPRKGFDYPPHKAPKGFGYETDSSEKKEVPLEVAERD